MTTPSYKTHDPKGWNGDPKRGAALGRASLHAEDPALFVCTLTVKRVELIDGYDENGTYFGSEDPLFWCASDCGEVDFMLRAPDRSAAVAKVKAQYPLGTVKPYAANGGMRATILRSMTRIAWCMAWSDHVDEYGCTNLSGCEITECAPEVPSELEADAEKALAEIEKRCATHGPLASATKHTIAYLKLYMADLGAILEEIEQSPIVAALAVAAVADAQQSNDSDGELMPPCALARRLLTEDDDFAAEFGSCLAHALVGSGIAWSDDHAKIPMPDIYSRTHLADAARDLADRTCEECALPPEIEKTRDERTGALPAFAWPGGYTLIYTTKRGNVLCSECAGQLRGTYDEGADLECDGDGCSNVLESSYGDPEEEPLMSATDSPEVATRVKAAFKVSDHAKKDERYQFDFEHGQWFVTELGTGRQWSVNDASGGDAIDGLCFEVVAEGEEG